MWLRSFGRKPQDANPGGALQMVQLEEQVVGDICVLSVLAARIDAQNKAVISKSVGDAVERGFQKVVLDLHRVDFVDSTGLGAIVHAIKLLGNPQNLLVTGLNDTVATLFRLTRVEKVLTVLPSVEEALHAFQSRDK